MIAVSVQSGSCGANGFTANDSGSSFRALWSAILFALLALALPASAQNDIETIAGGGTVNGNPLSADVPGPTGAVTDAVGNLYVAAPFSQYVFKKSVANAVTQFAGIGYIAYHDAPGPANTEPLWNPSGLAVDIQG